MKLPEMTSRSIMHPAVQTSFGGLDHNLRARDGALWWMENLSGREFPLLTPRCGRGLLAALQSPGGIGGVLLCRGTEGHHGGGGKGLCRHGKVYPHLPGQEIL